MLPPMKVEIVRSPRRRKTVTAEQHEGRVVVRLPAGLTRAEERSWVEVMVGGSSGVSAWSG